MEWFKAGLDEEQLKKEYKKLARQYHPDVSKDPDALVKMQEINYQFDQYYIHQKQFAFAWAGEARARQAAEKVRKATLVRMYWDKELEHYTTRLEYKYNPGHSMWGWYNPGYATYITGHAVDAPGEYTWENFKGGLAYVGYERNRGEYVEEVNIKRLPATITPASPEEIYWYNKDRWLDSAFDRFIQVDCKFGKGVIIHLDSSSYPSWTSSMDISKRYRNVYGNLLMKVTLPESFLIGNPDPVTNAKYEARSIQLVHVRIGSIGRLENLVELTGQDFPYMVFQNCTRAEFERYHDVDVMPKYADHLPLENVSKKWIPGCPDPIIEYLRMKGLIRFYCYKHNFRMMFGCFNRREMEQNMELMSIDDAEIVQDFLDSINENFQEEVNKMIKSGRLHLKI